MQIDQVLRLFANGLLTIDKSGTPFQGKTRTYKPGVGPYSETKLLAGVAAYINSLRLKDVQAVTNQKSVDFIIPGQWALEAKLVRPFGDNGEIAEHWSQNLLHPYKGNTSLIGDVYKLLGYEGEERKAVIAITYSHDPAQLEIDVIVAAFELLAKDLLELQIGPAHKKRIQNLQHPVHQQAEIFAWEVSPE